MGNGQYPFSHPALDSQWLTLSPQSSLPFSNVNPYSKRALRNTADNQEVQQYELQFVSAQDLQSYAEELKTRMERSNQQMMQLDLSADCLYLSPYIYTVKYFVDSSVQDMCSASYKGLVYAQKVDLRLKQINDIPLSDQLYLIKATLEGFKVLFENFSYFNISEEMIFITRQGKVKVWINSNLSKNRPSFIAKNANRDPYGSQSHMVIQLLDMIEENSDQQQEGTHFREYLIKKNINDRLSFYSALEQFQAYCQEQRHIVDDCMKSIYQLYHQQQQAFSQVIETPSRQNNHFSVQSKQQNPRNDLSTISKQSFSNLQLESKHKETKSLVGSEAGKQGHRQYSHQLNKNHLHLHKPNNSSTQKIDRQKDAQSSSKVQVLVNTHSRKLSGYVPNSNSLNPRNLPIAKRPAQIIQPSYAAYERESAVSNSKRADSLSTAKDYSVQNQAKPVIEFSYPPRHTSFNPCKQLEAAKSTYKQAHKFPTNLMTIHSIQTQSVISTSSRQLKSFMLETGSEKKLGSHISYYSSDKTYTLDKELAEDLQKLIGYNPKN